jgi:hypothetical protein
MIKEWPAEEVIYWRAYAKRHGPFWWKRADWNAAVDRKMQSSEDHPTSEYLLAFEAEDDEQDEAKLAQKMRGAGFLTGDAITGEDESGDDDGSW